MTFLSPEWLFLIPGLIALGWIKPELKFHTPIRMVLLLFLVLGMSRPVISSGGDGRDVWILVDQSDSVSGAANAALPELQGILDKGKGRNDNVYIVDFGRDSGRRDKGDPIFMGGTGESRIASVIENTLAQADSKRDTRLILLSDGYSTEPLGDAGDKLLKSMARLDYRLVGAGVKGDTRVADFRVPTRVLPGQAFLMEFSIRGTSVKPVPWELKQGDKVVKGTSVLEGGKAYVRLTDRMMDSGSKVYEVSIFPEDDEIPMNNKARGSVEVVGGSDIILATAYTNDPIADMLRAQGFKVNVVTNTEALDVHHLTGVRLVLLNNVPSLKLGESFLQGLDFFVREQSGGLAMIGGKYSFNSGGYTSTPVEDLLPVSMELKKDHRKLITSISFVLDRSGSMSMTVPGGETKIGLANRGIITSVELMLPQDFISVHAVDSAAHKIVGLTQVGNDVKPLTKIISRIESMGGGIFVYEGMKAGWEELKKSPQGTRHMILFSDANDSEQPGAYKDLIKEITDAGATVSVIALGSPTDVDSELLRDISLRGNGRIYFSDSGLNLPAIFSQETALVARSAFITDPVPLQSTPGWLQIAANTMEWPQTVDGYNLCYIREGAMIAALTKDEDNAPLVSFWPRGAGRVAAVTFPLGGEYSGSVRNWKNYGDFIQTLSRWLSGMGEPDGYSLRTRLDGDQLTLELLYSDKRVVDIVKTPPVARIEQQQGMERKIISPVWEKIEPGRFITTLRLAPETMVRGVVHLGEEHISFGPVSLASDLEWAMDSVRITELKHLSAMSGGGELIDFASVWKDPVRHSELQLAPWLLGIALFLLLLDAFLTRYGILIGFRGIVKR